MSSQAQTPNKSKKKAILSTFFITLASVIAAYYFTNGRLFSSFEVFFSATAWSMSIWLSQSFGNSYIIQRLDRKISWLKTPRKRLIVGFFALVTYSLFAFQLIQLAFGYFIFEWFTGIEVMSGDFWMNFIASGRIAVIISLLISLILTAAGFLSGWREAAIKAEQLERAVAEEKYATLLNKVDPHFLFNSLNVLTELVHENPDQAVQFIRRLSEVYRYILDHTGRELVSLQQELDFTLAYAELLEVRFGKGLRVMRSIDDLGTLTRGCVVPVTLQLLLENAVKHNVVSSKQPLEVRIHVFKDSIVVENTIQPKRKNDESRKLGLHYLKARYSSLNQGEVEIESTAEHFRVTIPIVYLAQ
jgi:sensor histidine kinase YesM